MTKARQLQELIERYLETKFTDEFHPTYFVEVRYVADWRKSYYVVSVEFKNFSYNNFRGEFEAGELEEMMEQIEDSLNNRCISELFN